MASLRSQTRRRQLSIYIPRHAREARLVEQLEMLARQRRRSLNFLVLEAIQRYLEAESNGRPSERGCG